MTSSRDSDEEDDYEVEDKQRRKVNRRNKEVDLRNMQEKQSRQDGRMRSGRLKRKLLLKGMDMAKASKKTGGEREDLEKMGRGKRREMLSQQRRKRLAEMLFKRRPLTEVEEDEDRSEESDMSASSLEEDRPIRKRMNRIDSDDDEEEYMERQRSNRGSVVEKNPDDKFDSDSQEKGKDHSLSLSNRQWSSRAKAGARSPAVIMDSIGSCRQDRDNGPFHPEEEKNKEEDQTDSLQFVC